LRDEREYKNGKIVYVGNPFEMDFGDCGDIKGYYALNFEDLNYVFFENKISPKHKKVKLSDFDNSEQDFANNIVKIVVDKKIKDGEYDKYSQNISNLKPFSFSFDNSLDLDDPKMEEGFDNVDMSGVDFSKAITDFVEMMSVDNKEEVLKYIMDLYKRV
jgi:DNA repair exonuclease SbcCD nuclease subunit